MKRFFLCFVFLVFVFPIVVFAASPDDPTLLGPMGLVDGSTTIDPTPTLTFTLSDPDVGQQMNFWIEIDNNNDFSSPEVYYTSALQSQGSTSFTVGQPAGGGYYTNGFEGQTLFSDDYYWRVVGLDDAFGYSNYTTANGGSVAFVVDLGLWTQVGGAAFSGGSVGGGYGSPIALHPLTGEPYIAFLDYSASNRLSVMRYDGSSWVYVGSQGFSDIVDFNGRGISLVFNEGTGTPFVSFIDSTGNINVMYLVGTTWIDVDGADIAPVGSYEWAELKYGDGGIFLAYINTSYSIEVLRSGPGVTPWESVGTVGGVTTGTSFRGAIGFYEDKDILYVASNDTGVYRYNGDTVVGWGLGGTWENLPSPTVSSSWLELEVHPKTGEPFIAGSSVSAHNVDVQKYSDATGAWEDVDQTVNGGNNNFSSDFDFFFEPTLGIPYLVLDNDGGGTDIYLASFDGVRWGYLEVPDGDFLDPTITYGQNAGELFMAVDDGSAFYDRSTVFAFISSSIYESPMEPTLLGPSGFASGGCTADATLTLSFTLNHGDSERVVRYRIQIADDADFTSVLVDYTSKFGVLGVRSFVVGQVEDSGSYLVGSSGQTLSNGNYFWRVLAEDDFGASSFFVNGFTLGDYSFSVSGSCGTSGVCGVAAKTYVYTDVSFSGDFCSVGTVSSTSLFPSPGSSVSWMCEGIAGGGNVSCDASRLASGVVEENEGENEDEDEEKDVDLLST
ncbi:MAG: hypothetical protein KC736_05040, partial [Candidatus Moranbacteria bacterium]|nr:hypothetical protein [Candidatus Moranbacteria bacterium]